MKRWLIDPDSFNKGIGITNGQLIGEITYKVMAVVRFIKQKPVETATMAAITAVTIYVVKRSCTK
jgi:hypothetical protein